ncbi:MAG: S8 family serine peptidase [Nitrospirae bacterium]|nr:S8 family serine peptidase [Nitrospirota bacterium]
MKSWKQNKRAVSFVILLLTVFCLSSLLPLTVTAGELSASLKSKVSSDGGYDKLATRADHNGSVRIIVTVNTSFRPMGSLPATEAGEHKRAISRAQDNVMAQLSSVNVISYYKYQYIPHIAMTVDRNALDAVLAIPDVISVGEDKLSSPGTLGWNITKIGTSAAWSGGYDGTGYTVAILDTGVDSTHPMLTGKVVSEACYSSNDNTSFASSICPGGLTDSTTSGSALPYVGTCPTRACDHGTHVAGIAAGRTTDNASGVAKGANIIAIQVFSRFDDNTTCKGSTPCALSYDSDQLKGLERVYALKGTYSTASANLSLGGGYYNANCDSVNVSLKAAIDNLRSASIATVISSGNESYTDGMGSPGCISTAVSVGATDSSDLVASYSNSASFLNLLAPGSAIISSVPNGGYASWNGTSMAAPHVAGAWAVLRQAKPTATVPDILSALTSTGVSVKDTRNGISKPRIQVDAALNTLMSRNTLSATKSGTGTGTITSNPSGISCGTACSASYTSGTSVTLTATADSSSAFSSWSGCDSTSGNYCTVVMSANKSVMATFISSSDYNAASAGITAIYNQYTSFFGAKSGGIVIGTSGSATYYVQWFTNGAALVAWTDGTMYTYYNGTWYALGVTWNYATAASTTINTIYNQYTSFFGAKSGGIVIGTSGSATYYVQWFTNGAALVAWTDGTMYTYYNGTWYALGVNWK